MLQRSILLFENAIKSEATRKSYRYHLEKFRIWAKVKDYDSLLQAPTNQIQTLLEDYVMYLKSKLSPNSIPTCFAPIELFYVMNDIQPNFKKIRKLFPEKTKKANGKPYTRTQIQSMVKNAISLRNKALILLLASSGMRIGAIPDIKIKNLNKIEDSYVILIYEGTNNEDYVFTTPEATKAIDEYLDKRKKDGEYFDQNSPLFRSRYRLGIEKAKAWALSDMMQMTDREVKKIDRKKITNRRYEIAKDHGFRKFFATIIKNTQGLTPTMTEKLINHVGVVQLDGSYFKPTVNEMFAAYKNAIPELTIDDSERLLLKNKKLEEEKSDLEKKSVEIEKLKVNLEKERRERIAFKNQMKLHIQDMIKKEILRKKV